MMRIRKALFAIAFLFSAIIMLVPAIEKEFAKSRLYTRTPKTFYHSEEIDKTVVSESEIEETEIKADVTVCINTATAEELSSVLPGIGEKKALAIVEYRELVGGFDSVDELIEVEGIGEKTLENIRPYCTVE